MKIRLVVDRGVLEHLRCSFSLRPLAMKRSQQYDLAGGCGLFDFCLASLSQLHSAWPALLEASYFGISLCNTLHDEHFASYYHIPYHVGIVSMAMCLFFDMYVQCSFKH